MFAHAKVIMTHATEEEAARSYDLIAHRLGLETNYTYIGGPKEGEALIAAPTNEPAHGSTR